LNRPELTAEKFGPQITLMTQMSLMKNKDSALRANFHHSSFIIHHSILYRTGDLARWLNDGNIEFLGRIDHQVKIRGFRIELEEIETRLVNHPDIKEAVVLAQEGEKGDKYLCAYIVTDREYKTSWIREFLAQELPGYMIPSYFVKIEKIPLTPNGKVNRGALPKPGLNINEGYIAARDKIETKLVEIWSEALGKDECHAIQLQASIGIDDNFFEWGGHSLKAMILASKIHKAFEVKIPLLEIFRNPTVRGLSNYIRNAAKNEYSAITPVEKKLYYDLSHAQNRLWILDKMEENQVAYNMPGTWESAELNREAFEKAVAAVIKRHEILRTTFITCEGIPKQKIHNYEALDFNPIYIDLRNEENKESLLIELKEKEENTPFNLEKGPLLRTKLLHIEENRHLFLFTMHHIISDGWSMDVMKKEFITLYDAYANGNVNPLPPLIIQYKDYTVWHNRQLSGEKLKGHRNYWLNRLSGEIPVLQLPTDYPRPKIKSFAGEYIFFSLSKEITGHLQQIGKECGSTLFITFLAAINVFLSGYTGQTDIIVGTPVAGREHKDLENQIGFYVNMLPLRNKLIRNETFRELLQRIKFDTLEAFEHQVYPFDQLVKDLNLTRDVSRNPLFDVVAAVQTAQTDYHQPGQIQGLNLTGENHGDEFLEIGFGASKHDLRFLLIETGNHADIHIQYNPDLFRMERILIMKEQFINLLTRLTTGIDKNLDSFDFLISIENKQSGMKFQGGF
jgi:acyl carrier protein